MGEKDKPFYRYIFMETMRIQLTCVSGNQWDIVVWWHTNRHYIFSNIAAANLAMFWILCYEVLIKLSLKVNTTSSISTLRRASGILPQNLLNPLQVAEVQRKFSAATYSPSIISPGVLRPGARNELLELKMKHLNLSMVKILIPNFYF